ncbi:MAG: glucose-6-phosphate 1-epimerase [Abditibacteriota bacterium]|nr:glucose-6-phosphate 1-epimerase [Abditibacteriota bacterium]
MSEILLPAGVRFDNGRGNLPKLVIENEHATAEIYLHGAHLTHWQPSGQEPVLWTSEQSVFASGQAVRGGVPICFPWFGANTSDPDAPLHGLARLMDWKLLSAVESDEGTIVTLTPEQPHESQGWPRGCEARFAITVGAKLEMLFVVANTDDESIAYEIALHTYFAVGDAMQIEISGTQNQKYFDKAAGSDAEQDGSPIRISAETDRVYFDSNATCVLHDPVLKRDITVSKDGSLTTVVWNPWVDKAATMADFGDDEWKQMVCIETANAGRNAITLAPGESHSTTAVLEVQAR